MRLLKRVARGTGFQMLQYTVVGTPCRRSSAEIEFRQTGRLARGRVSEKQPSEVRAGPPLGAKASRSKIQKMVRYSNGKNLKLSRGLIYAR